MKFCLRPISILQLWLLSPENLRFVREIFNSFKLQMMYLRLVTRHYSLSSYIFVILLIFNSE